MKKLLVVGLALVSAFSFGQFQDGLSVKKSPRKTETSTFGLGKVEIEYGSPKKKGRTLFGDLIPYGQVWRMGADGASTIEVSTDFSMGKTKVAKGEYAMFLIPEENSEWIFVLNKNADQWGAYQYDEKLNVAEIKVKASTINESVENLTMVFNEKGDGEASLTVRWGETSFSVPFFVEVLEQFNQNVDSIIENTPEEQIWAANGQAADFLLNNGVEAAKALEYSTIAVKEFNKLSNDEKAKYKYYSGWIQWAHARALAANGKNKEALKVAKEIKADNEKGSFYAYERNQADVNEALKNWAK